MSDGQLSAHLLRRTLPFLGLNAFAQILYVLVASGLVVGAGLLTLTMLPVAPLVAYLIFLVAILLMVALGRYAQRYMRYMVKSAHIAALTGLVTGDRVPTGTAVIGYGQEKVRARFGDVSRLFILSALVTSAVRAISAKASSWGERVEVPERLEGLAAFVSELGKDSLRYVEEAVLSYVLAQDASNVYDSARRGLVLYAKSYRSIVWTTLKLWGLSKVFVIAAFVLVLPVASIIILLLGGTPLGYVAAGVAALVGALGLERAFYEPFALTYTLVAYHRAIDGQQVDSTWERRLKGSSKAFDTLSRRSR